MKYSPIELSDSARELGALLYKHQRELELRDKALRRANQAFQRIKKLSTDPAIRDICNQQLGVVQREFVLEVST